MNIITKFLQENIHTYILVRPTKEYCKKYFQNEKNYIELPTCHPNTFDKFKYDEYLMLTKDESDYIGFIVSTKNEFKLLEISVLYINEKFRRMGFGEILMNLFPDAQVLYTSFDNEHAQGLYTKLGWKDSGIKRVFSKRVPNDVKLLYYNPKNISLDKLLKVYNEYYN